MYRVFLSYNTSPDEMVVVWRLQTLAAASGLHMDVPNPVQRSDWATVARMISESDSVIAFLTKRATVQVKKELEYALIHQKPIIPIVEKGTSTKSINPLLQRSDIPVFELDPSSPWKMENDLASFLQKKKFDKDAQGVLLALAGTVISLYLLQQLTES
ncbi:MAG TPA: toll/interleukin-1 receptor domain-containing protein [Pyrinomonadaceae bacterium]|jgi:hypothetical protein